jgi:hypothetical protein
MNRRVFEGFLFFLSTLILLVFVLWKPLERLHHQTSRLKEMETIYHSLKSKNADRSGHTALHEYLIEAAEKDFTAPFDEKECLDLLMRLSKKHHVTVKQFHFETPFDDTIQGPTPLPISYNPLTIELEALSETALRKMIESFNQSAKGVIFPRHLTITHAKSHSFLATYTFFGVRAKMSFSR